MELMKPPSPNTNELITSEPIYGFIGKSLSFRERLIGRLCSVLFEHFGFIGYVTDNK